MKRSRSHTIRLSMLALIAVGPLAAPLSVPAGASAAIASTKPDGKGDARFTDALPADAQEITGAIKTAKAGETITLRGRVASSKDAFIDGRAMFTLVDDAADNGCCPKGAELPDTSCAVPAESKATVQMVDASGKTLRESLSGKSGLKPGAEVFVTGTVQSANGKDALVVNAKSIHVPRSALPAGFFKDGASEEAKDVSAARAAGGLKVGDQVVLKGRIGGSADPFVDGRAVFTLVGRALKACNENPGDKCAQPWDYCCEPKEAILANSATVQVVDDKGAILKTDLKGRRGLKELSEVIVTGVVSAADGKSLVINATAMHVPP